MVPKVVMGFQMPSTGFGGEPLNCAVCSNTRRDTSTRSRVFLDLPEQGDLVAAVLSTAVGLTVLGYFKVPWPMGPVVEGVLETVWE